MQCPGDQQGSQETECNTAKAVSVLIRTNDGRKDPGRKDGTNGDCMMTASMYLIMTGWHIHQVLFICRICHVRVVPGQHHMGLQPAPCQIALQVVQLPFGPGQNPDLTVGHPFVPQHSCPVTPHTYRQDTHQYASKPRSQDTGNCDSCHNCGTCNKHVHVHDYSKGCCLAPANSFLPCIYVTSASCYTETTQQQSTFVRYRTSS